MKYTHKEEIAKNCKWTVALEWALQKEDGLQQVRDSLRLCKTGSGKPTV